MFCLPLTQSKRDPYSYNFSFWNMKPVLANMYLEQRMLKFLFGFEKKGLCLRISNSLLLSAAARLLRSWVRIPPGAWIFVCCECCVLSGRGLCDELITRPEESYRMWCIVVCDLETSRMRRPWPALGCSATEKKSKVTILALRDIKFHSNCATKKNIRCRKTQTWAIPRGREGTATV